MGKPPLSPDEINIMATHTHSGPNMHEFFKCFLTEQDINAVICGNIRSSARNILRAKRIELTYGVLGEVDDVMIRYLSGERLGDIDENAYWKAGREGE